MGCGASGIELQVGMYGFSYVGATQWLAAAQRPPHLVAIVPAQTSSGANRRREADDWPMPGTRFTDYFLDSLGDANTRHGNGRLTLDKPPRVRPADRYRYDPADPVPSADVLLYSTPPLEQPIEVTGPISVVLYRSLCRILGDRHRLHGEAGRRSSGWESLRLE